MSAQPSDTDLDCIDHFMLLSPTADTALHYIQDKTGVTPVYGGEHSGMGTCNYLLSLGDQQYLEILAPFEPATRTESDEPHDLVRACERLNVPKPHTFCVASDDLDRMATTLLKNNIDTKGPFDMQRQHPVSGVLNWRLLTCFDNRFGASFPFFIDWQECDHPGRTSPGGCELRDFRIRHPQHIALSSVFESIGIRIPVHESQSPGMELVVSTPDGRVVID